VCISLQCEYYFILNVFTCSPQSRTTSRSIRQDMQAIWNQHIDDYIAQGIDSRSREEIERAAKIRSGNGALYRVCKGNECKKVESNEVKFSVCSKCKVVSFSLSYQVMCDNDIATFRLPIALGPAKSPLGHYTKPFAAPNLRNRHCLHKQLSRSVVNTQPPNWLTWSL